MDTPTLLLVLVGVVLILLDQHRRAQKREAIRQDEARAARAEVSTPPVVVPTAQLEAPATESAPAILVVAENPDSAKPERKKKRRPLLAAAESASSSAKPMPGVLGLLKQRDALASAFVLSEILDVPLSRRRARSRGR